MIYIFLRGGFANLYFQLAFCAYISNLFDVNVKVLGDNIHPVLKNTLNILIILSQHIVDVGLIYLVF